ncbi:putative fatty acyl-CoA reductase CG5065 [Ceratina calcarata]|uniref:Fatty acyl-CoA reductase n=1 Tax=Ceratina calcarata TaxID=156304 RepID=A0AAJ7J8T8_9HYME|nr:putative fatty acyl-CoA reductase CG5065 [Ceratina calcarata]
MDVNARVDSLFGNETNNNGSSIEAFFAESVILLTGATGFLGKAILEKLLRSCPRLDTIFILVRPKRNKTVDQRHKELLGNTIFDKIRTNDPALLNKVCPVKGDVTLPNLGLSPEDRHVLEQRVNIVFHSAATVKFDEPLKVAVNLNAKGTERLLELCGNMKNLVSIVHISTAYSNANRDYVEESIYTTKVKPSTVIDMCESLDEATLNSIEKKILENHPNTYTFTKNLAEQIVLSKANNMPIALVRPSIICAAVKEPFPGWVDNITGITGTMMEIGRGVVRTVHCNTGLKLNVVPIDYVVDTIICASWHITMQQTDSIKIYNCTSNAKDFRWGMLYNLIKKNAIESPSRYMVWYPGCALIANKFMHNFLSITLHIVPAFIGDFFLRLVGNKPKLLKYVKRFERALQVGNFFTTHEWNFQDENMNDLRKKMNGLQDHNSFNVDMQDLDWDVYFRDYMLGIKKYILKENSETADVARNRVLMLYWAHRLTQISSIIIVLMMILRVGH